MKKFSKSTKSKILMILGFVFIGNSVLFIENEIEENASVNEIYTQNIYVSYPDNLESEGFIFNEDIDIRSLSEEEILMYVDSATIESMPDNVSTEGFILKLLENQASLILNENFTILNNGEK